MVPSIRDFQYIQELYHGPDKGRSENKRFIFTLSAMFGPVAFKRITPVAMSNEQSTEVD